MSDDKIKKVEPRPWKKPELRSNKEIWEALKEVASSSGPGKTTENGSTSSPGNSLLGNEVEFRDGEYYDSNVKITPEKKKPFKDGMILTYGLDAEQRHQLGE